MPRVVNSGKYLNVCESCIVAGMEKQAAEKAVTGVLETVLQWFNEKGISFSETMFVWTFSQLALIVMAWFLAVILSRILNKPVENQLRKIHGNRGLLRVLVVLRKALRPFLMVVFLWITIAVLMQVSPFTSRRQLVVSAASLASAWLLISIVSKFIRNKFLSKTVALVAWTVAALNILGLLPATVEILDSAGIQFDTFRLSLLVVFKGLVVFSLLVWMAIAFGNFADERIRAIEDLTPSLKVLAGKLIRAALLATAVFGGLSLIGIDFSALAVFGGAVGLGIGFGLQKVVSNLISGVILLTDKSIKPGDVITVGESYGRIDQLAARYVSVRARDGREYLVPNEDLITSQVINWTFSEHKVRLDVNFGVSYNSDPYEVRRLAKESAAKVGRVMKNPGPVCHITEFGDSSINFVLRFWVTDPDKGTTNVRGDVFLELWDALKKAGIEIPFPHRQMLVGEPLEVKMSK